MNTAISLVLIDEPLLATEGVVTLIRAQPGFLVLAASAEIEITLQKVRETAPDVVLLNLRQDGDGRLTLAGVLHGEVPESRVIVMGLEPLQADVVGLVRAGVSGFLVAGASFDEFLRTIRSVAHGIPVLPIELTHALFGQLNRKGMRGRPMSRRHAKRSTHLEQEVADLIALGLTNKLIAARLRIAPRTARDHVHKVLSRQAVNGRLEVGAFSQTTPAVTMAEPLPDPGSNDPIPRPSA